MGPRPLSVTLIHSDLCQLPPRCTYVLRCSEDGEGTCDLPGGEVSLEHCPLSWERSDEAACIAEQPFSYSSFLCIPGAVPGNISPMGRVDTVEKLHFADNLKCIGLN